MRPAGTFTGNLVEVAVITKTFDRIEQRRIERAVSDPMAFNRPFDERERLGRDDVGNPAVLIQPRDLAVGQKPAPLRLESPNLVLGKRAELFATGCFFAAYDDMHMSTHGRKPVLTDHVVNPASFRRDPAQRADSRGGQLPPVSERESSALSSQLSTADLSVEMQTSK